ncbi:hypothetical protein JCM33774_45190 [Actinophytocola sp. KF-1]
MGTITRASDCPLGGVPGTFPSDTETTEKRSAGSARCATCKRFARLWPGEADCDRCRGVLPLVFVPGRGERR